MQPKWIDHCVPIGNRRKGDILPNGLRVCYCGGYGFLEKELGDFYSQVKCDLCKGTGQIPKRIFDKQLNHQ